MANIVWILLYNKEEKLACYLTAFYKIQLNEELLNFAIINGQFEWLNYVWAFKKNNLFDKEKGKQEKVNMVDLFKYIKDQQKGS